MSPSDNLKDVRLLQSVLRGDSVSAVQMVNRLSPLISRMVFRLTGWHADTEDLVQEVFLQIQRGGESYRGESSLETWATSVTINCCRNWHRTSSRRLQPDECEDPGCLVANEVPHTVDISDTVRTALASLNHQDRELIVLRYLEEKSLDEISGLLGIRKNAVEVRLHRARKKLQAIFEPIRESGH